MLACGRCCCICHKFCGTHIEIHHIIQQADGGANTFENAIPLCLDCHHDMGQIDPHHPGGRTYTPNELKMHRDNWYAIVKKGKCNRKDSNLKDIDADSREYLKKYRDIRNHAAYILGNYANVYTDIASEKDERHEEARRELRAIGVMIKAFATEERPDKTDVPDLNILKDVGGLFIGLSNRVYEHGNGDKDDLLDMNIKSEDRIKELFGI